MLTCMLYGQGEIEKLPPSINTDLYDESSPVVSQDNRKLFFTRTADPDFESTLVNEQGEPITAIKDDQYMNQLSLIFSEIAGKQIADPIRSVLNQDIWYAPLAADTIGAAVHPGYPLNNALPNSLISTGMRSDEYVLLNQFYDDGSMYTGFSRVNINYRGLPTHPQPMHIYGFDLAGSDVNMTMTPNGHVLVLSMQGPDSKGRRDLYVSFYLRENVWSAPVQMGDILNSEEDETTPFISPDKRYLYFSSNRPGGPGGNDIYISERLDYTWLHWSEPVLVQGGINSVADESNPYFDPERKFLYFSSRRDGTSDIFRQYLQPKPRLKTPIVIQGRILNSETGQIMRGEVFWGQQSAKEYLEYFNSYNGEFEVTLTEYEPYKFQLRKPNHTAQRVLVDPRGIEKQGKDTLELTFYLDPKPPVSAAAGRGFKSETVSSVPDPPAIQASSFYDIYFVRGKSIMLRKSSNALSELLQYLTDFPAMEIMIIGHTDNVGDDDALQALSYRRAEAIKNYLVTKGVDQDRIRTTGKGALDPLYLNTSENGRAKNRRVEIKVLKS